MLIAALAVLELSGAKGTVKSGSISERKRARLWVGLAL
jgi:hypothetical protein